MKTIWKFPIETSGYQTLDMPEGAEILKVAYQPGCGPQLWAMVDAGASGWERREFHLFGTGHPIDGDPGKYVGTIIFPSGSLVFHLFEVI